MTNLIIEAIEQSELWKQLNATCKKVYEQENRRPSDEEYQALRNMLIAKVIKDDPSVRAMMMQEIWEVSQ
jgi:hypothetical protein